MAAPQGGPGITAPSRTTTEPFRFDRTELLALAESRHEAYVTAAPFPHAVFDDFLPEEVLDEILTEFPKPQQADWYAFDSATERKLATKDDSAMGPATRRLL